MPKPYYEDDHCTGSRKFIAPDTIKTGDSAVELDNIEADSIALSFWSPPYHVGKEYEKDMTFAEWQTMLETVIEKHFRVIKPGGFLVINIADILAFPDPDMPRIQASVPSMRKSKITAEDVLRVRDENPTWNRYQIAEELGCSEQTVQRRIDGNNVRGGKKEAQTRVFLVGGLVQEWAQKAGFFLYDRRVWHKEPCWENSQWHSLSYRAVDEFEYIYVFWKPGVTEVKRCRIEREEWAQWGSLAVWKIPSVRANDIHEAQFPKRLVENVVRLFSDEGDIVLDAFMGSGTTGIVAVEQRRRFMGIERDKKYAALARKRIKAAKPGVRSAEKMIDEVPQPAPRPKADQLELFG